MLSGTNLRVIVLGLFLAAGASVLSATSAYACHEDTGWCCSVNEDGHATCCYKFEGAIIWNTCHTT